MKTGETMETASTVTTEPAPGERLLTPKQLCERLQLSRSSVFKLTSGGSSLRHVRIGRSVRVRESDLTAWLEKNATASGSEEGGPQ